MELQVAEKDKKVNMNIHEPYPSEFGLKRASEFNNITVRGEFLSQYYCLIITDVLEHVPNPFHEQLKGF